MTVEEILTIYCLCVKNLSAARKDFHRKQQNIPSLKILEGDVSYHKYLIFRKLSLKICPQLFVALLPVFCLFPYKLDTGQMTHTLSLFLIYASASSILHFSFIFSLSSCPIFVDYCILSNWMISTEYTDVFLLSVLYKF